jgi:EAL domain-containing protein (putative c-di-GMP-specific phosphodiesterase class I)
VRVLRVLAEIVADQLDRGQLESEKRKVEWSRIRSILDRDHVDIEFQPIFDLLDCRIVSLEALARFWMEPMRGPAVWFAEANEVGLGVELELAAMRAALLRLDDFPPVVAIALNVSPATAVDPRFRDLLLDVAGAGFANLRHILRLAPDFVKLDLSLTHEIARDPAREALASSLVGSAEDVGASIVAEGISSDEDLALLRTLGVVYGQGFHLARPSALLN